MSSKSVSFDLSQSYFLLMFHGYRVMLTYSLIKVINNNVTLHTFN